jgi:hypothetical protein
LFKDLTPEENGKHIWSLGYLSSEKEESNDTDEEEAKDYLKPQGSEKKKPEIDEEDKIDIKNLPFFVDYSSPLTSFCFVNVQSKTITQGSQIFSCYGSRTNMFLLENYGFVINPNKYNSLQIYVKNTLNPKKGVINP